MHKMHHSFKLRFELILLESFYFSFLLKAEPWSSLYKQKSLACQITSLFNKLIYNFTKQPSFLLNGGSYLARSMAEPTTQYSNQSSLTSNECNHC